MRPVIYNLFGLPIHGYGLMIVIGFLILLRVGSSEVRRRRLPDQLSDVAMVFLLGGILGARIFFYIENYQEQFAGKSFLEFFKIWEGGLVFYGGAFGGLASGLLFMAWRGLPILDYFDVASVISPIGMAFGRLGCFLNGCCYGRLCTADSPFAVVFPPGSPAAHHHRELSLIAPGDPALPVHPVQLYQSLHDFLLFGGMFLYARYARPPRGTGLPLGLALYGVGRFFLEALRGDNPATFTGLTISQNISLALIAACGILWAGLYWGPGVSRARGRPQPQETH